MRFDLITPHARYTKPVQRTVVLAHGSLPTTDFYLGARLASLQGVPTRRIDTAREQAAAGAFGPGDFVIIVRHAPPAWLHVLAARQPQLAGVALLLDDDIPAALHSPELPLLYAFKTALRYVRARRMLARLCSAVWVSTPYLKEKYAHAKPRLLTPLYLGAPPRPEYRDMVYFYHGTSSHRLEQDFLAGVVRKVQARLPEARFEIIGDRRTRRLFRGIPRVRVLPPMKWPDFLAHTARVSHAVGLAPMLDSHFNQARSHVKLYDITRCGAAGIYSDVAVYRDNVENGVNGILCPNDEDAWVEAICRLLADGEERAAIGRNARSWCERHSHDPGFTLSGA
ncbi:MAG: glycosyltransferase [Pseudomonadota bacterium]